MTVDGGATAGQVGVLSQRYLAWRGSCGGRCTRGDAQTVVVPCRPLSTIMASAGYGNADFLSLDVEGAEARVLETIDPAVFGVVMVETSDPGLFGAETSKAHSRRVEHLLTRAGMRKPRLTVPKSTVWASPTVWPLVTLQPRDSSHVG